MVDNSIALHSAEAELLDSFLEVVVEADRKKDSPAQQDRRGVPQQVSVGPVVLQAVLELLVAVVAPPLSGLGCCFRQSW